MDQARLFSLVNQQVDLDTASSCERPFFSNLLCIFGSHEEEKIHANLFHDFASKSIKGLYSSESPKRLTESKVLARVNLFSCEIVHIQPLPGKLFLQITFIALHSEKQTLI